MSRKIFVLLMLSFFTMAASAQHGSSDRLRPKWLQKQPAPTNPTFRYETVSASAPTLDAAREKCLSELISSSGLTNGIVAVSDYRTREHISQVWENGRLTEQIERDGTTTTSARGGEMQLHVQHIAEYWTRERSGTFYMTRLYAKSELNTAPLFDNVEVTTNYVSDPATWGLALLPGAAQFHKGANLKGGLILGGTAALAAGIVFTENQRADYARRIGQTHDINLIRSYQTKRDHFATARNICIGAVAALYVYNLIDAIAMPGAQRVVVRKRAKGQTYAFLPAVANDGTPVMTASITF